MDDIKYGVLFEKILITAGVYMFKPQYLVEGTIYEDEECDLNFFSTDYGDYYFINEPDVGADDDQCVGYVISKNDLVKKYGIAIEDAKGEYFNDICSNIYLGFLPFDAESVKIISLDMYKLMDNLGSEEIIDENIADELTTEQNSYPEFTGHVVLEPSVIEEMLKSDNLSEIKEKLGSYLSYANDALNLIKKQFGISDSPKVKLIDKIYDAIYEMEDAEEIKKLIDEVLKLYNEFLIELEKKEKLNYDVVSAKKYVNDMIQAWLKLDFYLIGNSDNLDRFKDELSLMHKKYVDVILESEEEEILNKNKTTKAKDIDVVDMKAFFDDWIIGQENAKIDVISAIKTNSLRKDALFKTSCLLIGPTGSGKTMLAQMVSKYLDLPIVIIDSTQLTVPGYVGANLEDFLSELISKANGNLELAQRGIVVFDEIDKKGSASNEDVSGRGVLNTILPFVQGTTYIVTYNRKSYDFDTTNLTCFATGAFTNVAQRVSTDGYSSSKIGFNSNMQDSSKKQDIEYKKITRDDLVKYGGMPEEFLGRFSVITQLDGHTSKSLKTILLNKNSVLYSEKGLFEDLGVSLEWTDEYLNEVVNHAIELKTGARSLKTTVEESIKKARWIIMQNPSKYEKLILTNETVKNNDSYELVLKEKEKTLKKSKN